MTRARVVQRLAAGVPASTAATQPAQSPAAARIQGFPRFARFPLAGREIHAMAPWTAISTAMAAALIVALLPACSSNPPPPDWQMNAKSSLERATSAYLSGNTGLEALEFARARAEVARTGRPDLLARAELTRCAARVASLVFDDCPGFTAIAQDAPAAERAYADYLAGKAMDAAAAALLPVAQRGVATGSGTVDALGHIADPFSKLVAAGVLLRSGRAQPAVIAVAAETASGQGWSRPLLAWLHVQAQRADAAGETVEADRLRRQISLVTNVAPRTAPTSPKPP
jgi:hypothetical protein